MKAIIEINNVNEELMSICATEDFVKNVFCRCIKCPRKTSCISCMDSLYRGEIKVESSEGKILISIEDVSDKLTSCHINEDIGEILCSTYECDTVRECYECKVNKVEGVEINIRIGE